MQKALYKKTSLANYAQHPFDGLKGSLLKTLAYFDIFEYPLKKSEIRQFMDQVTTESRLDEVLQQLIGEKTIFLFNDFYSIQNNDGLAAKRKMGNFRADTLMPRALRIGRFLSKFPYVKAVAISGSLSKNYADEKADIDYFIITKENRLWIARTLLHLFKKFTFLTGRQHYYCMNYFVDEAALILENRNVFTAIELKTIIPAGGSVSLEQLFEANSWANDFLPASPFPALKNVRERKPFIKKSVEWIFNNRLGDRLDNYLMNITAHRWKRKKLKGKVNIKGQTMDLVTGKHFAWSNPQSFQEKVLLMYKNKVEGLKSRIDEAGLSQSK